MMKKRRLQRGDLTGGDDVEAQPRFRSGILWMILAILVVIAVWSYDRHELKQAREHIALASQFEQKSDFLSAQQQYRAAMENPRLSRKQKAELALKMARIYQEQLHDDELALVYFRRARRWYPRIMSAPEVKARMAEAEKRVKLGVPEESRNLYALETPDSTTTQTLAEPLIPEPESDREGPVVARIGDAEIHAGALARLLRLQSTAQWWLLHPEDEKLDRFLKDQLERELLFRAALSEGYHHSPAVQARLYDYQRTLLSLEYAKHIEEQTRVVSDEEVRTFWETNKQRFMSPERLIVGMIRHTSESVVLRAKERIRKGEDWAKVAEEVVGNSDPGVTKGLAGTMNVDDDVIPLLGKAPELAKALRESKDGEVLGPTKQEGQYVLLSVRGRIPRKEATLDEVRAQIEIMLRSRKQTEGTKAEIEKLKKTLNFEVDPRAKAFIVGHAKKVEAEENETTFTAQNEEFPLKSSQP